MMSTFARQSPFGLVQVGYDIAMAFQDGHYLEDIIGIPEKDHMVAERNAAHIALKFRPMTPEGAG